jgi:class 3 adenylate cyclase
MERLAAEPHTRLRYFCSPQHTDSALYPIISQMQRAAGFAHDDTTKAKPDKLDALLAQTFTPPRDAALMAEMLSLPNDGRYVTLELTPQQRRQKTLEALTAQLEALAHAKHVLMIFEDVHWVTALFCDLRGFTGFTESADAEDVMALLRDYHGAIGEIIIKYNGTLERYAGDGVMVIFNDPVPVENPALQAVFMALEVRDAIGWSRLGHEIGFGIGIAHGFATLGTIGFEGRFDYAAIGTVSNVASRLCDEAKPGQILISPRVLMKVENAVKVEPVGEFELKGIRRPLAAYNVVGAGP